MITETEQESPDLPFIIYRGNSHDHNRPFTNRALAKQEAECLLAGEHKQKSGKVEGVWMNTRNLEYGYSDHFGTHTVRFRVMKLS
jgi:hypothetical protein